MGQNNTKLPNQAIFHPQPNFQGSPSNVTVPGSIPNLQSVPSENGSSVDMTSHLSSLSIPCNAEMYLFSQPHYQGEAFKVIRGPRDILNSRNIRDQTQSLILKQRAFASSTPNDDQVLISYLGRNGLESDLFQGPLDVKNVLNVGIPNDSISTVKVGQDMLLTLYEGPNLTGDYVTLTGPYMGGTETLENRVSSFSISPKRQVSMAQSFQETNPSSAWIWILWLVIIAIIIIVLVVLVKSNARTSTIVPF